MAAKKSKAVKKAKKPKISRKRVSSRKVKPKLKRSGSSSPSVTAMRKMGYIVVYGMRIDPEHITRAAVEAYNKRRYTVHDLRLTEYITDPKFRNLMVKIAVLDRIEEELNHLYPDSEIIRPNTVTLLIR